MSTVEDPLPPARPGVLQRMPMVLEGDLARRAPHERMRLVVWREQDTQQFAQQRQE